jgi:hypothetical protein
MRNIWRWTIAALGLALFFSLILTPAASAWGPGYGQGYAPNYYRPAYPVYPSYGGYRNVGCVGCNNNYANPGYSYVYPYRYPYANNGYNYSYVYPYNNYNYNNGYNYSYSAPLTYNGGGWGSFGTYQNWANAFYSQHGRSPNQQDINDYWWSQGFAQQNGFSPFAPAPYYSYPNSYPNSYSY